MTDKLFKVSTTVSVLAPDADEARTLVWQMLNDEALTADADLVNASVGQALEQASSTQEGIPHTDAPVKDDTK